MLIELYILFEIAMLVCFTFAYFTKQELLWSITVVLAGVLMFSSHAIEYHIVVDNDVVVKIYDLMYMVSINFLFMLLATILFLFDLFEKYGIELMCKFFKKKDGINNKVYK